MVSQDRLGYNVYPHDSKSLVGVFLLKKGQILSVRIHAEGTEINTDGDKTFFGFYKLR